MHVSGTTDSLTFERERTGFEALQTHNRFAYNVLDVAALNAYFNSLNTWVA